MNTTIQETNTCCLSEKGVISMYWKHVRIPHLYFVYKGIETHIQRSGVNRYLYTI